MAQVASTVNGFHHVAMRVKSFDAAVKFFVEGLGCREEISWGEGDGRAIMLACGNGNCIEVFAGGKSDAQPEGAILHLALCTDNCDQALQRALAAGAEMTMPPTSIDIPSRPVGPTPVRIAFCRAPGGAIIEFFQSRRT